MSDARTETRVTRAGYKFRRDVEAAEAALREYGAHHADCGVWRDRGGRHDTGCTCGLPRAVLGEQEG